MTNQRNRELGEQLVENARLAVAYQRGEYTPPKIKRAYAIIIEDAGANFSAYAPDVPGCVATGATVEAAIANMREALAAQLERTAEHGEALPEPRTRVATVAVPLPAAVAR